MSWTDFEQEIRALMTPELAARVRQLRRIDEETWRGVSEEIFNYPEGGILTAYSNMRGHQPLGMFLCYAAADLLGEDLDAEDRWP